jgi:ComF family protein
MVEARKDGVVCADCWVDSSITRFFVAEVCFKCGSPLEDSMTKMRGVRTADSRVIFNSDASKPDQFSCGKCASLPFSAARACGAYTGALEASVLFLKSHPHICRRLREIVLRTFDEHKKVLSSDWVVPVPLHPQRERQRGFNQAKLIGRLISKASGLGLDDRTVVRAKNTQVHRAGLDAIDRAKSVERAFKIKAPERVAGSSVLLVDDVYTTGSTIKAISNAMIEAGALRVNVFTIARALSL